MVSSSSSSARHLVQIPLVVRPRTNSSSSSPDDVDILLIGDVVTWPEGTAAKILLGELRVATATFRVEKKRCRGLEKKKSERSRRQHTDMKITIHQAEARGTRPLMEDRYVIHLFNGIAVFGVFDGHGGTAAAEIVSQSLIPALRAEFRRAIAKGVHYTFTESNPQPPDAIERETVESLKNNFKEAIAQTEREALMYLVEQRDFSGTTLCACMCTRSTLLVANLGDSRVVLSRRGVMKVVTRDHSARDESEKRRIEGVGGFVSLEGYLGGLVQVSRAIGDIDPSTREKVLGLSAEPDIFEFPLDREKDEFIIVACDGLWEVMSCQAAVQHVRATLKTTKGNLFQATDDLVAKALSLGTSDNVTVIIAFLPTVEKIWAPDPPIDSPSQCDNDGRPRLFLKRSNMT
jgi:serine/threonine protein phosphatase PrpC